jgi:hypothetical protein
VKAKEKIPSGSYIRLQHQPGAVPPAVQRGSRAHGRKIEPHAGHEVPLFIALLMQQYIATKLNIYYFYYKIIIIIIRFGRAYYVQLQSYLCQKTSEIHTAAMSAKCSLIQFVSVASRRI